MDGLLTAVMVGVMLGLFKGLDWIYAKAQERAAAQRRDDAGERPAPDATLRENVVSILELLQDLSEAAADNAQSNVAWFNGIQANIERLDREMHESVRQITEAISTINTRLSDVVARHDACNENQRTRLDERRSELSDVRADLRSVLDQRVADRDEMLKSYREFIDSVEGGMAARYESQRTKANPPQPTGEKDGGA